MRSTLRLTGAFKSLLPQSREASSAALLQITSISEVIQNLAPETQNVGSGTFSGIVGSASTPSNLGSSLSQSINPRSLLLQQRRALSQSSWAAQQQATAAATTMPTDSAAPPKRPLSLRDRVDAVPTSVPGSKEVSMKAQVIFDASWKKIEGRLGDTMICPREVVWLNGAPGSGKGTNIPFILRTRGMSRAIGMSQLLDSSPEIKEIIDKAELVPDALVLDALLDAVLNPDVNDGNGLVIDGFPRTATQVDFVKLMYDKLLELHHRHADGPDEWRYPRPSFKVVILYVDEEESVRRQTKRAQLASLHNQRALDAGTGDVWNVRTTDISESLCRRRYQVFKAHYSTILRLKSYFPFSLIDAMGTLEECRSQIVRELRYQSSLDLDERTYIAIRHLPLARDLVRVARQRLVFRLDSYCKRHYKLFLDVIGLIDSEVIPLLKQCSLAGHAEFKTRHPLLLGNNLAVEMLIDVLSDRGFSVAHAIEDRVVPRRVELSTGEILSDWEEVHSFRITFDKENVRDLSTPSSVTTQHGEDVAIGATWVPKHLRREEMFREEQATPRTPDGRPRKPGKSSHVQHQNQQHALSGKKVASGTHRGGTSKTNGAAGSKMNLTNTFEHHHNEKVAKAAANEAAAQEAFSTAATDAASKGEEVSFLKGFESMDADYSSAVRHYGYELMNERED